MAALEAAKGGTQKFLERAQESEDDLKGLKKEAFEERKVYIELILSLYCLCMTGLGGF